MSRAFRLSRTLVVALALVATALVGSAPSAAAWPGDIERIEGGDRYETAALVARSRFSAPKRVYLATGEGYADALAAAGAAGRADAPVLLVRPDRVPAPTTAALDAFAPEEIVLLGGPEAISAAVEQAVGERWAPTRRIAGTDRYDTAARVYADPLFEGAQATVFVANGQGFADALSVGAKAAHDKMPLLLVQRDAIPAPIQEALRALRPTNIVVVGGESAVSEAVRAELARFASSGTVLRWFGRDRYATAAQVAADGFGSPSTVYLSTGLNFPDALAAGPVAGPLGAPVVLTTPECLAEATHAFISTRGVQRIVVLGGAAAVSDRAAAGSTDCPRPVAPPAPRYSSSQDIRAAFYYGWYPSSFGNPGSKYMPVAGHYDSLDGATVRRQIAEMRYAGIQAGIASWWGMEAEGPSPDYAAWVTDQSFQVALRESEGTPFTWSLYYEDEGYANPDVTYLRTHLDYIWNSYANHANYLWLDGRPVIFVWPDAGDGCSMVARWQQANAGRFHVVHKRFPGYENCITGADSWHQYAPGLREVPSVTSYAVSAGYYQYNEASPRLARDPVAYDAAVGRMKASGALWQLVTTYNEWGEGTAIEPSTEWGNAYLDILHRHYGSF